MHLKRYNKLQTKYFCQPSYTTLCVNTPGRDLKIGITSILSRPFQSHMHQFTSYMFSDREISFTNKVLYNIVTHDLIWLVCLISYLCRPVVQQGEFVQIWIIPNAVKKYFRIFVKLFFFSTTTWLSIDNHSLIANYTFAISTLRSWDHENGRV